MAHLAVVDVLATAVALRSGSEGMKQIKRVKGALKDQWTRGDAPGWAGAKYEED